MTTQDPAVTFQPTMTPAEVARLFRVDPKTVTRWAMAGKIRSIRTPGGHRRFFETDVKELLNSITVSNSSEHPPAASTTPS